MKEELYQFKLTLKGSEPLIWRRFLVEKDITFAGLHTVIQHVMGWENYHMYAFNVKKQHLVMPEMDAYFFGEWCPFTNEVNLSELVTRVNQKFLYIYDFEKDHQHEIHFEKRVSITEGLVYPVCLDGEFNCPAEEKDQKPTPFHIDKVNDTLRDLDW
jgi:hypothetical protein